jgi:hypothetical protein
VEELVEFDVQERRILGLPMSEEITGPEAVALRKIIDTFPLIKTVVECKFDPNISKMALSLMAFSAEFNNAVSKFHNKKVSP